MRSRPISAWSKKSRESSGRYSDSAVLSALSTSTSTRRRQYGTMKTKRPPQIAIDQRVATPQATGRRCCDGAGGIGSTNRSVVMSPSSVIVRRY